MNLGTFSLPKRRFDDDRFFSTDLPIVANGTILAGDLVVNSSGQNLALPTAGTAPWSALGTLAALPTGGAADTLQGSVTQTNASTTSPFSSVAAFADGSFVVVSGNNTGTPSFSIYDSSGAAKVPLTTVESVTPSWPGASVCTLASGDFVVAYNESSSYPRFSRYNKAGALQGSRTTVDSVSGAVAPYAAALASGDFIIAYRDNGGNTKFARYNASGVLQGSLTTIEAVAPNAIAAAGLPNGDFVIAYVRSSDGNVRFARYNSSGVLQGSIVTVATGINTNCSVAALPNGQFVVAYYDPSNNLVTAIYSSSGTLVSSTSTNTGTSGKLYAAATLTGAFVIATSTLSGSTGPGFLRFNGANVLQSIVQIEAVSLYSIGVTGLPNDQIVVSYGINGGVSKFARYTAAQSIIMGVAVEPASSGNTFRIRAFNDSARPISVKLRQNYSSVPLAFDHRTNGGAWGTVFGSSVFFKGI